MALGGIAIALQLVVRMIPRVKPEGMLSGKPLHTSSDHAPIESL